MLFIWLLTKKTTLSGFNPAFEVLVECGHQSISLCSVEENSRRRLSWTAMTGYLTLQSERLTIKLAICSLLLRVDASQSLLVSLARLQNTRMQFIWTRQNGGSLEYKCESARIQVSSRVSEPLKRARLSPMFQNRQNVSKIWGPIGLEYFFGH